MVSFLEIFPPLFDILEYANIPTLQNSLPVYHTLYEAWQPKSSDAESVALMKREFLKALTDKNWASLNMLHFVATFLDPTLRGFLFVRNLADRQGYLKQVNDSLLSLAQESNADSETVAGAREVPSTPIPSSSNELSEAPPDTEEKVAAQPTKKTKTSPFDWFQIAPSPSSQGNIG